MPTIRTGNRTHNRAIRRRRRREALPSLRLYPQRQRQGSSRNILDTASRSGTACNAIRSGIYAGTTRNASLDAIRSDAIRGDDNNACSNEPAQLGQALLYPLRL